MAKRKTSQQAHFRNALKKSRGRAEQVIVVFVDVRGFSAFSSSRDSVDIGLYVRRLFLSLIETYFPRACYHKSTGDGMMIVYPYQEKTLARIAKDVIGSSVSLYLDFDKLSALDTMITFEAPNACGIGINRGTVCCIESNEETLDYSGHVLNLAARLMDLARPEGIVMHASLGNMIPENYVDSFELSSVYVRGIAENQPVPIYSLKGATSIPGSATSPPPAPWGVYKKTWNVGEFKTISAQYYIKVPSVVKTKADVHARFYWPDNVKGMRRFVDVNEFNVKQVADETEISFLLKSLKAKVENLSDDTIVWLQVKHRQT